MTSSRLLTSSEVIGEVARERRGGLAGAPSLLCCSTLERALEVGRRASLMAPSKQGLGSCCGSERSPQHNFKAALTDCLGVQQLNHQRWADIIPAAS